MAGTKESIIGFTVGGWEVGSKKLQNVTYRHLARPITIRTAYEVQLFLVT
jgi:hypothetical protein